MQSSQAQRVVQTPLANVSRMGGSWAFDRVRAFVRLLDGRAAATDGALPNYGRFGWCDPTEQQLIDGVTVRHRTVTGLRGQPKASDGR